MKVSIIMSNFWLLSIILFSFCYVEVDTGVEELIQKYLKEIEDLRYLKLSNFQIYFMF